MRHPRSASAAIALLIVLFLAMPSTAAAQTRAAARSASVTTATAAWGAVSTPVGGTAAAGSAHSVSAAFISETTTYFDIVSLGTLPLTGQYLDINSSPSWGGPRNPSLTLDACVNGTWRQNRCSGSEVALGTTTSGEFAINLPLEPGERFTVRLYTPVHWGTFVSTINVSVSRAQARGPVLTNA